MGLIDAISDDYVIIITARPDYQMAESLENVKKKTGWLPDELYFNDIDAEPPEFKESALKRFVFPRHGEDGNRYYAVESNPKTREMYAKYGIEAMPYVEFMKKIGYFKVIRDAVKDIEDLYPGVERATIAMAEMTGKKREIVSFIKKYKPTTSQLILFFDNIDPEMQNTSKEEWERVGLVEAYTSDD